MFLRTKCSCVIVLERLIAVSIERGNVFTFTPYYPIIFILDHFFSTIGILFHNLIRMTRESTRVFFVFKIIQDLSRPYVKSGFNHTNQLYASTVSNRTIR